MSKDEGLKLEIGSAIIKKLLPLLIGGGVLGGGAGLKAYHDSEIDKIKAQQVSMSTKIDNLNGKVDTVIEILRKR